MNQPKINHSAHYSSQNHPKISKQKYTCSHLPSPLKINTDRFQIFVAKQHVAPPAIHLRIAAASVKTHTAEGGLFMDTQLYICL